MRLSSTVHDPTRVHAHRRAVFRALLWFSVVFGVLFALINYANGRYDFTVIELFVAGLSIAMLSVVRTSPRLRTWIVIYLVPFFLAAMYVLATTGEAPTVFTWSLLFPLMSHLLLGRRLGGALAAAMLVATGVVFFVKYGAHSEFSNPRAIGNVVLSALCIFGLSHVHEVSRERAESELRHMALTDPLTGLANRSRLDEVFRPELAGFRRHGTPLALLMVDIDHFKSVNDRYGHEAGDAVLCRVARLMVTRVRPSDWVCRLGGEEFCILLGESTLDDARHVAEDLRRLAEGMDCVHAGCVIPLSISIGVAELGADGADLPELLHAADERLYAAKRNGRNRVHG